MSSVPPPLELLEQIQGSILTQAIYVAAELGIADRLADGPLTAAQIAERVQAHPEATYRLLRLLASYSIFAERDDGRFELTPKADALRSDSPMSMRQIAVLMGHPIHWEDWSRLDESVRTGEPSMPKHRGMSAWDYFQANPEYGAVFFSGMGNMSDLETEPVVAGYDYSRFGKIVDVGAGRGTLLAAILRQAPSAKGVAFAIPSAEDARQVLDQAGVADRCTVEEGSFLDGVPAGGDAYLLKHIVHDLPEPETLTVLKNIRKAINPKGRLLLAEFVLGKGNDPHPGKLVDLWLMLLVGGKERTAEQYADLFAAAGFRLTRVVPTASPLSIVEAEPA